MYLVVYPNIGAYLADVLPQPVLRMAARREISIFALPKDTPVQQVTDIMPVGTGLRMRFKYDRADVTYD